VLSDGSEISAHAIVIASGMQVRYLDAPGVADLIGAGVYYGAALSEASMYSGKHVYVVGGANSAGQGAMFFSRRAKQVTMLVRGPSLAGSMSQYLIDRIQDTKNVEILYNAVVASARGRGRLEGLTLTDVTSGATREVDADAMFIFVGSAPRTEIVAGLIERDAQGFILTGRDLLVDGKWPKAWTANRDPFLFETSVPGMFAAGDVRHGSGKRVASAVGEGSATVSMIHEYLKTV
jgi:thioredoxin reductase (NADPH)